MAGEEEGGGVEAEGSEEKRGVCAPHFIGELLGEVRKSPNEEWRSSYTIVYRRSTHGEEGDERICSDGFADAEANGAQLGIEESAPSCSLFN